MFAEGDASPDSTLVADPTAGTALAAIGAPQAEEEPKSAADVPVSPVPTSEAESPSYTTPVDPATTPLPVAGIPSHPYAASTPRSGSIPASPASHRSGPPQSAFGQGQIATTPPAPQYQPTRPMPPQHAPGAYGQPVYNAYGQPVYGSNAYAPQHYPGPAQRSIAAPPPIPGQPYPAANYGQPPAGYNAYGHAVGAATVSGGPVGSGVAAQGDVASYRRSTATGSTNAGSNSPTPSMTTNGQVASYPQRSLGSTSSAAGNTPTDQFAAGANPRTGDASSDSFSKADPISRNQMRDTDVPMTAAAVTSELPGIRVATHGPSEVMIRQTNEYEIRVENRGSIDASGVLVRALVPDWAEVRGRNATRGEIDNQPQGERERLVWTIDELPAGSSETMYVRLMAARSGVYDLDVDWTLMPQKSVAKVKVHEPQLNLTIEGPDEVVYGESQTYKVRVLNPGDGTAPNVVFTLSPNSATPQSQQIGDIPPGKEAQFDVELTAKDLGDLQIHGLASGDLDLRAEQVKTIRVASAQLEAVLSGPELKYQNTEAMYTLQVQNEGSATSQKIQATLRLPAGVEYMGGIDEATQQGNALRWEITSLAPGTTRDYQFRCNMKATGEHMFAFDCKGTAAGDTGVSIATRVESIADLVLLVNDPPAPAPIGSEVTYEIIIRNRGSKEARDVRAVAQFSHGIEPQRIEGQSGDVVTGQVLFDSIPRIGAGEVIRLRVIAKAERGGHHRFRTEVRSGDTVLVAEEATHYMSPRTDRVSRRSSGKPARR